MLEAAKPPSRSFVAIEELGKEEILQLLDSATVYKQKPPEPLLRGKVMATCFYEPSTRTRLSFESAMLRLGGQVIGFCEALSTSSAKGESLTDAMRVISHYADLIVLRHPQEGTAKAAANAVSIPVINAGDGANQHPTQTLIDLFSIIETQGRLEGLQIALAGDLKHARTVHSLARACSHYGVRLYLISPDALSLPDEILSYLRQQGVELSFHHKLEEVIHTLDILYMTRLQEERLACPLRALPQTLTPAMLKNAKPNLKILHPLPRREELDPTVDETPFAYYFEQARNGLFVRQALLNHLLH